MSSLKVTDVAERSGVSPGAIYYHWKTQQDFREAVIAAALSKADAHNDDFMATALIALQKQMISLDEVICYAVWDGARKRATDPNFTLAISLWTHRADPAVRDQVSAHYRTRQTSIRAIASAVLAATGFRCRPGVSIDQFATTISCVWDGIAIRLALDPDIDAIRAPHLRCLDELLDLFDKQIDLETKAALRDSEDRGAPSPLALLAIGAFRGLTEPF